jgi:two-component system phosphate regulon response regulator PhoB
MKPSLQAGIYSAHLTARMIMSEATTILLTDPTSDLVETLAFQRPDLRIVGVGGGVPDAPFSGPLFGFIDWLLPRASGLELCRSIRKARNTRHAHLTLVLEADDDRCRRRALDAGADDYLLGPLTPDLLIDRIDSRASGPARQTLLSSGELSVDLQSHRVRYAGRALPLRPLEFRLLVHFLEHPDQVFARAELIQQVWSGADGIDGRSVDVCIGRLRAALAAAGAPDPLRTVRTVGYVFDSDRS